MGDFWTHYKLDNGRQMSPRQIKRVEELEGMVEWYCAKIGDMEMELNTVEEKIARIKRGGKKKSVAKDDQPF